MEWINAEYREMKSNKKVCQYLWMGLGWKHKVNAAWQLCSLYAFGFGINRKKFRSSYIYVKRSV